MASRLPNRSCSRLKQYSSLLPTEASGVSHTASASFGPSGPIRQCLPCRRLWAPTRVAILHSFDCHQICEFLSPLMSIDEVKVQVTVK